MVVVGVASVSNDGFVRVWNPYAPLAGAAADSHAAPRADAGSDGYLRGGGVGGGH